MDSAIQRPAHFVKELTKAREKFQRRAIAENIGAQLASLEWKAPVVQESKQTAFKPDPRVDQLLEDFLSDDDNRRYEAGSQLGKQIGSPSPALVTGICEAIEELAGFDLNDDRIGQLAITLSLATDHQPELTPADLLQDLLANYSFDDSSQTLLYASLARVRPDWIVENRLARALGVAVDQRAFNMMFLSNLGVAYPELVIRFADLWWQQVGWDMTSGSEIAQAFEQIADKRPEQIEAMIALLKAQQGEPLGADMIDLRADMLSAHIEKLVRIKGGQAQ
jgi:hypothetical protein